MSHSTMTRGYLTVLSYTGIFKFVGMRNRVSGVYSIDLKFAVNLQLSHSPASTKSGRGLFLQKLLIRGTIYLTHPPL